MWVCLCYDAVFHIGSPVSLCTTSIVRSDSWHPVDYVRNVRYLVSASNGIWKKKILIGDLWRFLRSVKTRPYDTILMCHVRKIWVTWQTYIVVLITKLERCIENVGLIAFDNVMIEIHYHVIVFVPFFLSGIRRLFWRFLLNGAKFHLKNII